jgi:hypothetical protein
MLNMSDLGPPDDRLLDDYNDINNPIHRNLFHRTIIIISTIVFVFLCLTSIFLFIFTRKQDPTFILSMVNR